MKFFWKTALVASIGLSSMALGQSGDKVGAKLGMGPGGVTLGAEYSVQDTAYESFAGYLTIHQKDEDEGAPGLLAFGMALKLHQEFGPYEIYMAPGFGIIQYDGADDELLIGPRLAIGAMAKIDRYLSVGFENQKLYSFLGEFQGGIDDSFLFTTTYSM
ncbi:MAG: hypothetical protein HRU19_05745 [Pseudobacteriovorax sp.]|nr:hypothetical protein [Pseudobacteriovorax sp.]